MIATGTGFETSVVEIDEPGRGRQLACLAEQRSVHAHDRPGDMADFADESAPAPTRSSESVSRVFYSADGTRWHVSERPFGDYDRRRGMSLIFASDFAVRRVRDFPVDWHTLSDEELLALSWGA
jgi:hypothetical protein